jgi:hypothetical protein
MGLFSDSPVRFGSVSMVTTSLGSNDPELGQECMEAGVKYRFVYNAGNSQILPGYGVVLQSAATNYSITVSAATSADWCQGVVKHATLTTGAYGWVVTQGITPVQMGATSGSVASRGLIELGADGVFVPVSNTTGNKAGAVGQALAAIVSSASGSAFVNVY